MSDDQGVWSFSSGMKAIAIGFAVPIVRSIGDGLANAIGYTFVIAGCLLIYVSLPDAEEDDRTDEETP